MLRPPTPSRRAHGADRTAPAADAALRAALGDAGIGTWAWDTAAAALVWSASMAAHLGVEPEAAVSYPAFLARVHPDDRADLDRDIRRSLASASDLGAAFRVVTPAGEVRWLAAWGRPSLDARGGVARLAGVALDITERRAIEHELRHLALHDPLTGLANRSLFFDRVAHALAAGRRYGEGVAVLFLDLDGFKRVNDALGHAAGDDLLAVAARRLARCVRAGDTVARLGGDEFAVLLERVDVAAEVGRVAERAIAALTAPIPLGEREVLVGVSIGAALGGPPLATAEALVRAADTALYRAKRHAPGTVALYDPGMAQEAETRLALEDELRRAIVAGELRLHYQPEVDLATGRIGALEALVRWQHPRRGLLPPAEFVPLAEATGLVVPLGEWVLGEACRQAVAWERARPDLGPLTVGVNVAPQQVVLPEFAGQVADALAAAGLPAGRLRLELTESALEGGMEAALRSLAELRRVGVSLALDDFGTGHSSLTHLRRLPVDVLKLDRSFVRELSAADPTGLSVVGAVATLGRELGMTVVAEGVETADQQALLRRQGVDRLQGYCFAPPLPAEAVGAFRARWRPEEPGGLSS